MTPADRALMVEAAKVIRRCADYHERASGYPGQQASNNALATRLEEAAASAVPRRPVDWRDDAETQRLREAALTAAYAMEREYGGKDRPRPPVNAFADMSLAFNNLCDRVASLSNPTPEAPAHD